jgi:hypothetical protein
MSPAKVVAVRVTIAVLIGDAPADAANPTTRWKGAFRGPYSDPLGPDTTAAAWRFFSKRR